MDAGLSIFLNSFVLMVAGAICAYVGMSACFEKRHSPALFWAYMAIKGVIWSVFDVLVLTASVGDTEPLWRLAISVLAVLTYIVFYYTWRTDFCKLGIAAVFTDGLSALSLMAIVLVANVLYGEPPIGDYRASLGPWTALIAVASVAFFVVLVRLVRPVIRWFANYEIVHKRLWTLVVFLAALSAAIPRMNYDQLTNAGAVFMALMMSVALACGVGYMRQRAGLEKKRRELLLRERQLVSEYDRAMGEQLDYLSASAVALDAVSANVARVERMVEGTELSDYVAQLSSVCERLRHGVHSDCPALDVVLTKYESEFFSSGLSIEYRVPPLGDAANQAALVVQAMLGWVLDKYGKRPGDSSRKDAATFESGLEFARTAKLRIARKGNQLVFVMEVPSNRKVRFPKRLLEECSIAFRGALLEDDDGSRKVIRVLIEEDQLWRG